MLGSRVINQRTHLFFFSHQCENYLPVKILHWALWTGLYFIEKTTNEHHAPAFSRSPPRSILGEEFLFLFAPVHAYRSHAYQPTIRKIYAGGDLDNQPVEWCNSAESATTGDGGGLLTWEEPGDYCATATPVELPSLLIVELPALLIVLAVGRKHLT